MLRLPLFLPVRAGHVLPLLVLLVTVACDPPADAGVPVPIETGDGAVRSDDGGLVGNGDRRADEISGTLVLEGEERVVTLRLHRSDDLPGLPFSTYLPPGVRPDPAAAGAARGPRERFTFGDEPSVGRIEVVVLEGRPDSATVARLVDEVAGGRTDGLRRSRTLLTGAEETWLAGGGPHVARVDVLRRGGAWVAWVVAYPSEMGDGMEPRAEILRNTWLWSDDGAPLASGASAPEDDA